MKYIKKIKNKYDNMSVVVKSSIWFVICGFLQRGISVITTPIFTRLLSPDEYGIFSVFNSWLEIITIIATLRLGYGVYVKGLVKYSDDRDNFSSSLLSLASIWCGIFFIIYILFRDFWNSLFDLSTILMICMFVMMISTIAFNFWAAQQRNDYKYKKLVLLTLLISILKPVSGVVAVLCFKENKVAARIIALALTELVLYSGLYFKIITKGKKKIDLKYWKYALAFNLPLVPHFLSQVILNHTDRIMIKSLIDSSAAGIYSLAYSIGMILTIVNTAIMNTLRPWTFQTLKQGHHKKVAKVGYAALIIVGIANLLIISFAPEIIAVFSPSSYSNAKMLITPISMGVFFAFMYNLFVDIQMNYEKTNSIMVVAIICAMFNIATNYIFIKEFGYVAAAYTTLFSYLLMAILHYIAMTYILKKKDNGEKVYNPFIILAISVVFVVFAIIMTLLQNLLVLRIVIICVALIIVIINKKRIYEVIKPVLKKGKK